jgi:mannosyl-oligosaccharide alpha-1,2-mannosidase
MYFKTMNAVREHMLYRPMLPNDRNVLFSAEITTSGRPEIENDIKLDPEVTHLTCFLGGMVGMGAKVFGLTADMDIAEKLTDGCVWAYEATATGIMPEKALTMPCEDASNCPWNQTRYWEYLDPKAAQRNRISAEFKLNQAKLATDEAAEQEALIGGSLLTEPTGSEVGAETAQFKNSASPSLENGDNYRGQEEASHAEHARVAATMHDPMRKRQVGMDEVPRKPTHDFRMDEAVAEVSSSQTNSFNKEVPKAPTHDFRVDEAEAKASTAQPQGSSQKEVPKAPTHDFRVDEQVTTAGSKLVHPEPTIEELYAEKLKEMKDDTEPSAQRLLPELPPLTGTPSLEKPLTNKDKKKKPPLTHEEYVKDRIRRERLPPGFVTVLDSRYILRFVTSLDFIAKLTVPADLKLSNQYGTCIGLRATRSGRRKVGRCSSLLLLPHSQNMDIALSQMSRIKW